VIEVSLEGESGDEERTEKHGGGGSSSPVRMKGSNLGSEGRSGGEQGNSPSCIDHTEEKKGS